jgi:branched-chain amino acid transport system ATP-binding protein
MGSRHEVAMRSLRHPKGALVTASLQVEGLCAGFGATQVLHGVDLEVAEGTVTALLGLNGAGKSVALKTIAGLLDAWSGSVRLDGADLSGLDAEDRVRSGLGYVLQAQALFPGLTVEQNLRLGGATLRGRGAWREAAARIYESYPRLAERRRQPAGSLSGGEQAMLAMGRALMTRPRALLVDEPTAGLSPVMVGHLVEQLAAVRDGGATILLVEQNVRAALALADEVCVLQKGAIAYAGEARTLDRDELARLLGMGDLVAAGR